MPARVLIISEDPVGAEMGGNAIRAYELARVLALRADVTLAAPGDRGELDLELVPFDRERPAALRPLLARADVVLALPHGPAIERMLVRAPARLVHDLYDPKLLQVLESLSGVSARRARLYGTIALDHVMAALAGADLILCASERQRDLWIGAMLGAGLITPARYAADPTLRALIDVVPFGVDAHPPRRDAGAGVRERFPELGADTQIVLWNGGLWNWLDPVGAVEAFAEVAGRNDRARLVFMGRPPGDPAHASAAATARGIAESRGLLGTRVFFNDSWVPYDERGAWLLGADCALSMHHDHLETRYSFRTRILDCFWAGLPVVCTSGDELAGLVAAAGLGAVVQPGDQGAAAEAILEVLRRGRGAYTDGLARAAQAFRWETVAEPLVRFVEGPAAAGAGPRPRGTFAPGRRARAEATRAARLLQRTLRRGG